MKNIIAKLTFFLIFTTSLLFIFGCNKEDRIPYAYVNLKLYTDLPEYNNIKTPGNYMYLPYGYAGIILYCRFSDTYIAYERCCPNNPFHKDAILDVDSTDLFMVCRECSSKFIITDGTKVEGPSKNALVTYKTLFENNILYIYN